MRDLSFQNVPLTDETAANLSREWEDLAQCAIEKNVFLLPWFVRASIPLLKPQQPQIVTVYSDDQLIGLTIVQPDSGYAKVPVSFFRSCIHYHQFLATPLIREGYAEEFFRGLGEWLDASPQSKSFCILSLVSDGGEISEAADAVFAGPDRAVAIVDRFERAAICGPLAADVDPFEHIGRSRLKGIRRRLKGLSKLGSVSVDEMSKDDDPQEWLEEFVRVENASWKRDSKTSIAENPMDAEIYRELVRSAHQENALSFLRLSVDGVPIAYTLDLRCGSFVYCLKCGYDAAYRQYAPGVILEFETLKKYYRPDMTDMVDSCTSPDNTMINDLWPDRKKVRSIAFSKSGNLHKFIFRSVFLLKQAMRQTSALNWKKH